MRVQVVTRAIALADKPLAAEPKVIDWHDSSDRKWLMNHLHHCMMNAKSVTLNPTVGDSNNGN